MSRQTVRAGVAAWLTGVIPGLNSVFTSFPDELLPVHFQGAAGDPNGAVAVVFIPGQRENRIAMGGAHGGWKRQEYAVEVHVYFRATYNDGQAAMDGFDAVLDAVALRLRADRTLDGTVWQAAEGRFEQHFGLPTRNGDIVEIWGSVDFDATEMLPT